MTDKITPLKIARAVPNPDAIALLREWLEMAHRGELQEVALAGVGEDGAALTAHSGARRPSWLIGALEIVKMKLLSDD